MTTRSAVNSAQRIGRKRLRQQGIPGLTAGPIVAAHLNDCLAAGWMRLEIARDSCVSDRAIRYILGGQKTVQAHNAARLLAIRPEASPRVNPVGTIRRIKALARAGYPIDWTAEQIDCSHRHVYEILNGTVTFVDRALAGRLTVLYRRIEATPGPSNIARLAAAARDWTGPEGWDDDTIDDPKAEPDSGTAPVGVRERAALRREEIIHFAWHGHQPEQIVDRMGGEVALSTVRQIVQEWRTGNKRARKLVAS